MNAFLAIDASTDTVSAALFVDGALKGSVSKTVPPRTPGTLLSLVPPLLESAGMDFSDLGLGFAIGRGPGSYAGLRTCVSTVNGWALPFRHPVWAVPSPFATAAAYFAAHAEAASCCVAGRARRDTAWVARFVRTADGLPVLEGTFELRPVEPAPEADVANEAPSAEWIGRLRLAGLASDVPLPLYLHPAVATPPKYA